MKNIILTTATLILIQVCNAQTDTIDYFGMTPPGKTITKFAPGIVSNNGVTDYYVSFSPDGKEMYYGTSTSIKHAEYIDDKWQDFTTYIGDENYTTPVFSPVEGLIYLWQGPANKLGYIIKDGDTWSEIQDVTELEVAYPTATLDSCVYFQTDRQIYYSKFNGTTHSAAKKLPFPINDNPKFTPINPAISIYNDYIVFLSPFGECNVSFKKNENHWTYPKKVSDFCANPNNVSAFGQRPKMSPDGKYMFAGNYPPDGVMDIFWVSTSIFEDARNSNFAPYVRNNIPDQFDTVGNQFIFTIPDSIFIDDDGNQTLTMTATFSKGQNSFSFDSVTNTISGNLVEAGSCNIKIIATDTAGASVYDLFKLTVEQATTAIDGLNMNNNIMVFPNPASQILQIYAYKLTELENYQITDLNGKLVQQGKLETETINVSAISKGVYLLILKTHKNEVCKKMVIID